VAAGLTRLVLLRPDALQALRGWQLAQPGGGGRRREGTEQLPASCADGLGIGLASSRASGQPIFLDAAALARAPQGLRLGNIGRQPVRRDLRQHIERRAQRLAHARYTHATRTLHARYTHANRLRARTAANTGVESVRWRPRALPPGFAPAARLALLQHDIQQPLYRSALDQPGAELPQDRVGAELPQDRVVEARVG
jgi:hypothetical protein